MSIRGTIAVSHERVWQYLESPGTWLTAAERVAVAAELRVARSCELCIARKAALPPAAVRGEHEGTPAGLSATWVELIHKLVTDPGRIARGWVKSLLSKNMVNTEYDTDYWVPNVHRAFSLVPEATRVADDLMKSHYFLYAMVPRYTDADHTWASG